jgi:hypothetical protein
MIADADGKIDKEISEVAGFEFLDVFAWAGIGQLR